MVSFTHNRLPPTIVESATTTAIENLNEKQKYTSDCTMRTLTEYCPVDVSPDCICCPAGGQASALGAVQRKYLREDDTT